MFRTISPKDLARYQRTSEVLAALEIERVNYRITEVNDWVIVHPSGKAQNNEPFRVKYLFHRWLTQKGIRVIVNLKEISQFGVWEMGLLTSFKKEVGQRAGILRLCNLSPCLQGYFQNDALLNSSRLTVILRAPWRANPKAFRESIRSGLEIFYQKAEEH